MKKEQLEALAKEAGVSEDAYSRALTVQREYENKRKLDSKEK